MTCYNCESTVLVYRCDACKEQFCSVECLTVHLKNMTLNKKDLEYFMVRLGGNVEENSAHSQV